MREQTGMVRTGRRGAIVVRPQRGGSGDKLLELLHAAGCAVREGDVIPAGTTDAAAVAQVLLSTLKVLVVPFHAHRDAEGGLLDGWSFVRALGAASPGDFRWKVIMPVSGQGAASHALTTASSSGSRDLHVESSVLTIDAGSLGDPLVVARVDRFLQLG